MARGHSYQKLLYIRYINKKGERVSEPFAVIPRLDDATKFRTKNAYAEAHRIMKKNGITKYEFDIELIPSFL